MENYENNQTNGNNNVNNNHELDKDVIDAVVALGALGGGQNQSTPSLTSASTSSHASDEAFLARMSKVPIVQNALKAYEKGKESSKVMKFSADLMEASMKTITAPVLSRLEPQLEQLDEFAIKQLDRLGKSYPYLRSVEDDDYDENQQTPFGLPIESNENDTDEDNDDFNDVSQDEDAVLSRWHNVLYEAGQNRGGLSAAFSEESMKSLQYCLHWLNYATQRVEDQLNNLQQTLTSPDLTPDTILSHIKSDLISVVKNAIDVLSTYASQALPEQSKEKVHNTIMVLPQKWAAASNVDIDNGQEVTLNLNAQNDEFGANRILLLATESLEMLKTCTSIFIESLDKAEAWLEKLRDYSQQRRHQQQQQQQQQQQLSLQL